MSPARTRRTVRRKQHRRTRQCPARGSDRRTNPHPAPHDSAPHNPARPAPARLSIRNRQRTRPLNARRLREWLRHLLAEHCPGGPHVLGVHLVDAREMTRLNEFYLHHTGSTDVITFDHSDGIVPGESRALFGEIYICIDDAVAQARQYRTSWPAEVVRYLIHGLLHLLGYDDHRAADRRVMKREENRWLTEAARRFPLSALADPIKLRA